MDDKSAGATLLVESFEDIISPALERITDSKTLYICPAFTCIRNFPRQVFFF